MKRVFVRRGIYVLVAFAFLGGLAGEAYGPHGDHAHEHRADCSCVGVCHGAAASPVPAKPDPRVAAADNIERPDQPPTKSSAVKRTARYLLPLANAPPAPRFFADA